MSPTAPAVFSLGEARGLVRDLARPNPWIYWLDFLASILIGHAAYALTRLLYDIRLTPLSLRLALQLATFAIQCACYYRAAMFIHEIAHLPRGRFRVFRVVWNLLCGIPFLVPSFTYTTHLEHHRPAQFGTPHDGEYLPLARLSPWWIVLYLSQCLWLPPLAVIRFGILGPLAWLVPPLAGWLHVHASSLVMDLRYARPDATAGERAAIRLQELGCFLFLAGVVLVPIVLLQRGVVPLVLHAYATAVVVMFLNSLRTLTSHRWQSDGRPASVTDQLLDSIDIADDSLAAILVAPVGLRYHATHHLFPAVPYHNLGLAHRRLLAQLPADSPYRQAVEPSLAGAIRRLWSRPR